MWRLPTSLILGLVLTSITVYLLFIRSVHKNNVEESTNITPSINQQFEDFEKNTLKKLENLGSVVKKLEENIQSINEKKAADETVEKRFEELGKEVKKLEQSIKNVEESKTEEEASEVEEANNNDAEVIDWVKELKSKGRKVFSQNDEDGAIEAVFEKIGVTDKIYVEFGVESCTECNTRYLR